jgi:hypothetical protein
MPDPIHNGLREQLHHLSQQWMAQGLPTRERLETAAKQLADWKRRHAVQGLWPLRPRMVTATLDDGMGHGLALIERFAAVLGLSIHHLGLLQRPEPILSACHRMVPEFLGLTVLHPDSEDDLARIGSGLPPGTCLIAGGPAFTYDPAMAHRCAVAHRAQNVAYFIDFVLNWTPLNAPTRE